MAIIKLTKDNFEQEVLKSEKPVLVDFYADWCGPCQMLSPIVDEVAEERDDIKVGKINVDEQMELAQKYGVMTIPTLLVIKNGEIANKHIGALSKSGVIELLKEQQKNDDWRRKQLMEGQLLFLRRTITKIKIAIVNKKTDNRKDSIGNR